MKLLKTVESFRTRFGLDPASRSRIEPVPEGEDTDISNVWNQFGSLEGLRARYGDKAEECIEWLKAEGLYRYSDVSRCIEDAEEDEFPHVAEAIDYAQKVRSGDIPACKWVRLVCERQLKDLAGEGKSEFIWDAWKAERVCRFIEMLPHVKGTWETPNLTLEPWQKFILTTVFGWVRTDGTRRFKTVYIEVPRKNGKSSLSAAVVLYMLLADGEEGAECYSAATVKNQARIVFDTARHMVRKEPQLRERFGVVQTTFTMSVEGTASKFEPLSSDEKSLEGLNIHCGVIDELHAHRTRRVYDVIETAAGSRRQPLIWIITTAGTNQAGICYEVRGYVGKVLDRVSKDETFFGVIYSIDEADSWDEPATWEKANPNYNVSVFPSAVSALCKKARHTASAQPSFMTKHLNVWVNADIQWMDMFAWKRAADLSLDETDFEGEPCWQGIDLASKIDIASRLKLFKREVDGEDHYYGFADHYLPELTIEKSSNSQYEGWRRDGWLTATPGEIIDFDYIEEDLKADKEWYEVREVAYDPFQATQFSTRMRAEGFPMVELGATVKNFSEPMKELEALVLSGRLHHNGDPVLEWMVSNVVAHLDAKDNIYPQKRTPRE